ncbi:MAG TPA: rhomboid family intramembrane serine protease [Thermoleophilia bacterium]|nr:rhomboid family intramembrane serine protease [Thermoleophilia bacterium]
MTTGEVHRFPGGDTPPDFPTRMPEDLEVRYCYRHPDRETGVSCSNCGRPICHECMIAAPVGFRCPECVRQQNARGSRARVVTRAQTRSRWSATGPGAHGGLSVTKVLIGLNVLVFALGLMPGIGLRIQYYGALSATAVLAAHEYWRLLTALFIHAGIFHIFLNMWALWLVGGFIERAVGRGKFLILYLLAGFSGSVLVLLVPSGPVVGASGAIFGIFGALAVHAFLNQGRDLQSSAFLRQVLFIIGINLLFTFTWGNISWQAHVGGLIGGAAVMYAMMLGGRKDPRRPFGLADGLAVGSIALLLLALAAWRMTTFSF